MSVYRSIRLEAIGRKERLSLGENSEKSCSFCSSSFLAYKHPGEYFSKGLYAPERLLPGLR